MATYTDSELLEKTREAIHRLLTTGETVEVNGRRFTSADLTELERLESRLQKRVARADRGGIRARQVIPRG